MCFVELTTRLKWLQVLYITRLLFVMIECLRHFQMQYLSCNLTSKTIEAAKDTSKISLPYSIFKRLLQTNFLLPKNSSRYVLMWIIIDAMMQFIEQLKFQNFGRAFPWPTALELFRSITSVT